MNPVRCSTCGDELAPDHDCPGDGRALFVWLGVALLTPFACLWVWSVVQ